MNHSNKEGTRIVFQDKKERATLTIKGDIIYLNAELYNLEFAKKIIALALQACLIRHKNKMILSFSTTVKQEWSTIKQFDYLNHLSKLVKNFLFAGGSPPKFAHILASNNVIKENRYTAALAKQMNIKIKGFETTKEALIWLNT